MKFLEKEDRFDWDQFFAAQAERINNKLNKQYFDLYKDKYPYHCNVHFEGILPHDSRLKDMDLACIPCKSDRIRTYMFKTQEAMNDFTRIK